MDEKATLAQKSKKRPSLIIKVDDIVRQDASTSTTPILTPASSLTLTNSSFKSPFSSIYWFQNKCRNCDQYSNYDQTPEEFQRSGELCKNCYCLQCKKLIYKKTNSTLLWTFCECKKEK